MSKSLVFRPSNRTARARADGFHHVTLLPTPVSVRSVDARLTSALCREPQPDEPDGTRRNAQAERRSEAAFARLVPGGPTVTMRPMFGNLSAFVNGNMFAGLFGEELFVRLSEDDSASVRKQGGRDFEVMPGRAMRGYVTVPSGWRSRPDTTRAWIATALGFTAKMPPKVAGAKKAAPKRTAGAR